MENLNPITPANSENCIHCQIAWASGATFCPKCGRNLNNESKEKPEPVIQSFGEKSEHDPSSAPSCINHQIMPTNTESNDTAETEAIIPEQPPAKPLPKYKLTCTCKDGSVTNAQVVAETLSIGSAGTCDLPINNDPWVSRMHAKIAYQDNKLILEDPGSTNGTFLKVNRPVEITPGDTILIGTTTLIIEKTC
ncbi:MAG: FHA domain-containing protein [Phycisphaerae bacterium]|nr:FHA domain-containing protein [Phycisphaerae bacterium]